MEPFEDGECGINEFMAWNGKCYKDGETPPKQEEDETQEQAVAQGPAVDQGPAMTQGPVMAQEQAPKKSRKKLIAGVAAVVSLILVAVLIIVLVVVLNKTPKNHIKIGRKQPSSKDGGTWGLRRTSTTNDPQVCADWCAGQAFSGQQCRSFIWYDKGPRKGQCKGYVDFADADRTKPHDDHANGIWYSRKY